jgi:multiple sugar transport system substrate-binding protein
LIETLKAKNLYNNFLPGLFEAMKTPAGYVAVPYQVDVRVWYYNKALLEKAGAEVPTDWPSYISAGKKLAKIGAYGFGLGGGSGNNVGSQVLVSLMIANGGGLFDEYQKPNCVTERNIEAMEFVLECSAAGMVAPGCAVYTLADVYNQWTAGKFAMGGSNMGLKTYTSGAASKDLVVMPPFKGPHGTEGTFMSPNNIMMYKETPTQAGSEAFLLWYLEHMHVLWDKGVFPDLPVQKSVEDSPAVKLDTELYDEASLWLPVGKTYGAPGGSALFAGIGAVDGAPPLLDFAQTMLEGKTSAKGALQTLQSAITSAL